MKKPFLPLVTAFVLGAVLAGGAMRWMDATTPDETPIAENVPEIDDGLAARVAQLESELTAERARADAAVQALGALQENLATRVATEEESSAGPGQRRFARLTQRMTQGVDQNARMFENRLGLDAGQSEQLRHVLSAAAEERIAQIQARFSGETPPESTVAVRDELAEFLTDAQLAEYDAITEEQRQGRLETAANAQLTQLSSTLALDEGQKDAVYSALYRELDRQTTNETTNSTVAEDLLAAEMQTALSPEQFETWTEMRGQTSGSMMILGGGGGG